MHQSIPTYCMHVFLLLATLEDELQKMMNNFWWGSNAQSRKGINWLNRDKLTMKKEFGVICFRHLRAFNLAKLGNQGWRFLSNQGTMIFKVSKAKYFPHMNFLDANLWHDSSYVWLSIHNSTSDVLRPTLTRAIFRPTSTRVYFSKVCQEYFSINIIRD